MPALTPDLIQRILEIARFLPSGTWYERVAEAIRQVEAHELAR